MVGGLWQVMQSVGICDWGLWQVMQSVCGHMCLVVVLWRTKLGGILQEDRTPGVRQRMSLVVVGQLDGASVPCSRWV